MVGSVIDPKRSSPEGRRRLSGIALTGLLVACNPSAGPTQEPDPTGATRRSEPSAPAGPTEGALASNESSPPEAVVRRPWRIAVDVWDHRSALPFDEWKDVEEKALSAIRALERGDADYVEARCRFALRAGGGISETLWLEALDEVRRTAESDPERRFRFLDKRPLLVTDLRVPAPDRDTYEFHTGGVGLDPEWCRDADEALIRFSLVRTYFSDSMTSKAMRGDAPPTSPSNPMRAAGRTFVELFDDVEKALGPDHPFVATMIELGPTNCPERLRRNEKVRQCLSAGRGYRKALEIREAALTMEHPALRASRMRVAVLELQTGKTQAAIERLESVVEFPAEERTDVTAMMLLGVVEYRGGQIESGLARLAKAAEISNTLLVDDWWAHMRAQDTAGLYHFHAKGREAAKVYELKSIAISKDVSERQREEEERALQR